MSERDQILKALWKFTIDTGIAWEVNFDDFELLSVNFIYADDSEAEDE